jgi:hypothetical protein
MLLPYVDTMDFLKCLEYAGRSVDHPEVWRLIIE